MALDNAQFISELSPIDPPGTDPLNQGDDHIRTVKLAVQQSFPNVGSAVPQTGAQMAQMAIKNEVNTFTQRQIFQGQIESADGVVLAPGYSFTSGPDTGMFKQGAILSFAVSGGSRFDLSTTVASFNAVVQAQNGSAGAPTFSFFTNTNTGMYRSASNVLAFATAGVERITMDFEGIHLKSFTNSITKTSTTNIAGFTYKDAGGFSRWLVGQSTANNQERFTWQRRDAAGAVLDSPLEIFNTTGQVNILQLGMQRNPDTVSSVISAKTAGQVTRHTLNFEATGSFNPNSWTFSTFNSAGTFQNNPFRIGPAGELFMEALPTTNPGGTNRLWKSSGFVAIT